jgi:hypothetical protein
VTLGGTVRLCQTEAMWRARRPCPYQKLHPCWREGRDQVG